MNSTILIISGIYGLDLIHHCLVKTKWLLLKDISLMTKLSKKRIKIVIIDIGTVRDKCREILQEFGIR